MITTLVYAVALMSQQVNRSIDEVVNEPRVSIPKPIHEPLNINKRPIEQPTIEPRR